jgi:hypothetical protein
MSRTVRNLTARPLPDLEEGDPLESVCALFRRAEENALAAIDWYLWKKSIKSRCSRGLRSLAIILAVCGGIVPIVASARPSLIAAEWGYVLLAASAGCLLYDRYFGFTSSWMRYMRAQARLSSVLMLSQANWAGALLTARIDPTSIPTLLPIVEALVKGTAEIVEQETAEWATELSEQSERLHRQSGKDNA